MSRRGSYSPNEGRKALALALGGVTLVGLVGYVLYRVVRRSRMPPRPQHDKQIGPGAPGGRPQGRLPGMTLPPVKLDPRMAPQR